VAWSSNSACTTGAPPWLPGSTRRVEDQSGFATGTSSPALDSSCALLAPRVAGMLSGVSAHDPFVLVMVAVTLLSTAALASGVAAWRALRVDPGTALRAD